MTSDIPEPKSRIVVNFPAYGQADPDGVLREHVTTGQIISAGVWLLILAVFSMVEHLRGNRAQDEKAIH